MYQNFPINALVGVTNKQLGFEAQYVRMDNPTGQWFYEGNSGQYFPPYTLNMIIELDTVVQVASCVPLTPLGTFSAPIPGQKALVTYFSADVIMPLGAGGGGQNPAGAEAPIEPALSAGEQSGYRQQVEIVPLSPLETGVNVPRENDRVRPAPLRRVEGPLAGTPTEFHGLLTPATIEGLTLVPHDEQGRVMYGDSFERANPENLWTLTNGTLAGSAAWALSGSKSGLASMTGASDFSMIRRFPLPTFGGFVGVEAIINGASASPPNGAFLRFTVNSGRNINVFGIRYDADVPSYWDNVQNAWVEFEFPPLTPAHHNNVGSSQDLTAYKVVFQNALDTLAYSHIVVNGCVFNLFGSLPVTNLGTNAPPYIDVEIGLVGDTQAAYIEDVKVTSNEPGNTPTTITLGDED